MDTFMTQLDDIIKSSKGAVEFRLGGWGSVSSVKKQSCQIFPAGLHIKRTFENTPSVFESPFLN